MTINRIFRINWVDHIDFTSAGGCENFLRHCSALRVAGLMKRWLMNVKRSSRRLLIPFRWQRGILWNSSIIIIVYWWKGVLSSSRKRSSMNEQEEMLDSSRLDSFLAGRDKYRTKEKSNSDRNEIIAWKRPLSHFSNLHRTWSRIDQQLSHSCCLCIWMYFCIVDE